jgi:hypothetical protein
VRAEVVKISFVETFALIRTRLHLPLTPYKHPHTPNNLPTKPPDKLLGHYSGLLKFYYKEAA